MVWEKPFRLLESVNDNIDSFVGRLGPRRDAIKVINKDERVVRSFPYFLAMCLLVWIAGIVFLGDYSISKILEVLCLVFVSCFALLGVPCMITMEKGIFSNWAVFAEAVVLSILLWFAGLFTGHVYFAEAIVDMIGFVGIPVEGISEDIIGFLGTLAILYFTSIGVLTVVSSYLRIYMPTTFSNLQRHADEGKRGKSEKFFMIPDIIDVHEVVLEPPNSRHLFDFYGCLSVSLYLFILGLMISSYLFLNPYFWAVMDWHTMIAIMLMLSMFTPALILPWQIFRHLGAKVTSDAPRDYYLWTGAKRRLFTTFATMGAFMMMFLLSVYLGTSVWDIIRNYVTFLIPLAVTSAMYGILYANNFEKGAVQTICERFEKKKRQGR